MTPRPLFLIDDADENFLPHLFFQIDNDRLQLFAIVAAHLEERFFLAQDGKFHARFGPMPAADEKTRPAMRSLKRDAGERAGGIVRAWRGLDLIPADPEFALVGAAIAGSALIDGIATNRLTIEGIARGGPVFERAVFKIEVERFAVRSHRFDEWIGGFISVDRWAQSEHEKRKQKQRGAD